MNGFRLETERLLIRDWRDEDRAPFAALNADPEVMRFFPAPLSRAESDAMVDRLIALREADELAFLPVVRRGNGAFLGMSGLVRSSVVPGAGQQLEIGWRFHRAAWGQGYAAEAARAGLAWAFANGMPRVIAFTAGINLPSRRLMERVGMQHDPGADFDHPRVPDGPLRRHVLYRIADPAARGIAAR